MKKILSILILIAVAVVSVQANVDNPKSSAMEVVKSANGFKLFYKGIKRGDIKVTIYNSDGQKIHSEKVRKIESFVRPYNLASLSEGDYKIEVQDENGTLSKTLNYSAKSEQRLVDLIQVKGSDNKFMLRVANKTGADELRIKILDSSNEVVYESTEQIDGDFAKIYQLKNVGPDFVFQVTDKAGVTHTVTR